MALYGLPRGSTVSSGFRVLRYYMLISGFGGGLVWVFISTIRYFYSRVDGGLVWTFTWVPPARAGPGAPQSHFSGQKKRGEGSRYCLCTNNKIVCTQTISGLSLSRRCLPFRARCLRCLPCLPVPIEAMAGAACLPVPIEALPACLRCLPYRGVACAACAPGRCLPACPAAFPIEALPALPALRGAACLPAPLTLALPILPACLPRWRWHDLCGWYRFRPCPAGLQSRLPSRCPLRYGQRPGSAPIKVHGC